MTGPSKPTIVVTGASSGIGRELALEAAKDGQSFILIGRNNLALRDLESALNKRGATAVVISMDLRSHDMIDRIESVLDHHSLYCDVLINSAGFGIFGPIASVDEDLQLSLIDVNIRAGVTLTRHFLPGMIARGRGGIINVSSITAYAPGPYMAAYCASKAFIRSYTAALASELRGTGVRVTCLTPGVVRTPFFERSSMGSPRNRMMKLLPRGKATTTAQSAWLAFRSGKSIVVPRAIDQFIIAICRVLPDRILVRIVHWLNQSRSTMK